MRRYFLIAREVGALTRAFSAKLEAEHLKTAPRGPVALPARPAAAPPAAGRARLPHRGRPAHRRRPGDLRAPIRSTCSGCSSIADQRDLDLHPDAFTAATRSLHLITSKVRRDPAAAKVFLDVLARGRNPQRTLELMNEAGVLGRYIPEFGRIVAQMQFNMYHSYTVDEHTLRAVGVIADIAAGRFAEDHPLATAILPLIEDREALFLAMLLHDTGKGGVGGQEKAGARAARQACERMGLERSQDRAGRLAGRAPPGDERLRPEARRRRPGAPSPPSPRIVENPERLRLLLVLTVADIRAVGPGRLERLEGPADARALRRDRDGVPRRADVGRRRHGAPAAGGDRLRRPHRPGRRRSGGRAPGPTAMEDAYFAAFTADEQTAHCALARRGRGRAAARRPRPRSAPTATPPRWWSPPRTARACSPTWPRPSPASAAMWSARASSPPRAARRSTSSMCRTSPGQPFGSDSPRALARLVEALESRRARRSRRALEPRKAGDLGRAAAFAIAPAVTIDNDASADATVIEVSGRDRPGLLAALARILAEAELSIQSAHIDNYGERAVDAFYVVDPPGQAHRAAARRRRPRPAARGAGRRRVRRRPARGWSGPGRSAAR